MRIIRPGPQQAQGGLHHAFLNICVLREPTPQTNIHPPVSKQLHRSFNPHIRQYTQCACRKCNRISTLHRMSTHGLLVSSLSSFSSNHKWRSSQRVFSCCSLLSFPNPFLNHYQTSTQGSLLACCWASLLPSSRFLEAKSLFLSPDFTGGKGLFLPPDFPGGGRYRSWQLYM